jgi:hypothetical protein
MKSQSRIDSPAAKSEMAKRHDFLANTLLLSDESADRFWALLNSEIAQHRPETELEMMLIESMAQAKWTQPRLQALRTMALFERSRTEPRATRRLMNLLDKSGAMHLRRCRHDEKLVRKFRVRKSNFAERT